MGDVFLIAGDPVEGLGAWISKRPPRASSSSRRIPALPRMLAPEMASS